MLYEIKEGIAEVPVIYTGTTSRRGTLCVECVNGKAVEAETGEEIRAETYSSVVRGWGGLDTDDAVELSTGAAWQAVVSAETWRMVLEDLTNQKG